jgi:hypothetical protein
MRAIDALLKASIIVAVAIAATAVAYHYVFYLPARDATLDAERRAEAARISRAQIEQQERGAAQQAEQERRATAEKYEAEQLKQQISARYERCNLNAVTNYSANWDSACARISQLELSNYNECLSTGVLTKAQCDTSHKKTTKPENCSLPRVVADGFNSDLSQAKDRCLKEFQLGLH